MRITKTTSLALITLFLFFISAGNGFAQGKEKEIKIKTNFHCNGGKSKIESELSKEVGISSVFADLDTKIVTIKYDPSKQNKKKLVKAIEKTGHTTEFTKGNNKVTSKCGSNGEEDKDCSGSKKQ